jgi:hypothetical protein
MPRVIHLRRPGRAAATPKASEDSFERWVVQVARAHGWKGHHTRKSFGVVTGVSREDAYGWPDWIFWHPRKHRLIARELKTEHGRISVYQRAVLEDLVACGIDAKVWRPSDAQEVMETFAGEARGTGATHA